MSIVAVKSTKVRPSTSVDKLSPLPSLLAKPAVVPEEKDKVCCCCWLLLVVVVVFFDCHFVVERKEEETLE